MPVIDGVLDDEDTTTTPMDSTLSGSTVSGDRASFSDTVFDPSGTDICYICKGIWLMRLIMTSSQQVKLLFFIKILDENVFLFLIVYHRTIFWQ